MTNMTVQGRRTGAASMLYATSSTVSGSSNVAHHPSESSTHSTSANNSSLQNTLGNKYKIADYLLETPIVESLLTRPAPSTQTISKSSNLTSANLNSSLKSSSALLNYNVPTQWNEKDKCSLLALSRSNLRVSYQGTGKSDSEAATVRTNHYIPPQCGIYYFEIDIIDKGRDGYIGIGFSTQSVSVNRLPGWELNSWGYHGDDGNSFASSGTGKPYGPSFTTGDVVGCCLNFITREAFYTKNGVSLGIAFRDFKGMLFPAVGMRTPKEVVEANFGAKKFRFDIDMYVRDERERLIRTCLLPINFSPKPNVTPNTVNLDVNKLIYQYFEHHGYAESMVAIKKHIQPEGPSLLSSSIVSSAHHSNESNPEDDVTKRKHIHNLLKARQIQQVIDFVSYNYPNLLDTNSDLMFVLDCRRWIEMMRPIVLKENLSHSQQRQDAMDLDAVGGQVVETESDLLPWLEIIKLGRSIYKKYQHDMVKLEVLRDYALLFTVKGYDLNEESECTALIRKVFDDYCIEADAAFVNAAILEYQGKDRSSLLERMIQQVVATREAMVEEGMASASIMNPLREFL